MSRKTLCALLALLLLAPVLPVQAASYTMEEAIARALEANPQIDAAGYTLKSTESARKTAQANFGPSLDATYNFTQRDKERYTTGRLTQDRSLFALGMSASQTLFSGFNLLNTYQKRALEQDRQALQLQNTRLDILSQVQITFLNHLKNMDTISSLEGSRNRAQAQLDLAQAGFNVGLRPRLDILQAEQELSRTNAALIQAENALETGRAQLNTLLNIPVNEPTQYVGALNTAPVRFNFDDCLATAFRQRPDLLMAEKSVAIAQKDLGITNSAWFPKLSASLTWNTQGSDLSVSGSRASRTGYSNWQAGLGLSWNLFGSGRRYFATQQAKFDISSLESQRQSTVNNAANEIKADLLMVQNSERQITVAEAAVRSATEAYDMAKMRYELQLGTNLDLLTAQTDLSLAEASLISAKADYLTAISKLYVAIGEMRPTLLP